MQQPGAVDLPAKYLRSVLPALVHQHCIAKGARSMDDPTQWRHVTLDLVQDELHAVASCRVCLENPNGNAEIFEFANAACRRGTGRPATA